jgi:hypothetical protein
VRKGTTLFVVERRVLEQVEAEFLGVGLEGFPVVADDEGEVSDRLWHDSGLWRLHDVECVEEKISHRGHRGGPPFEFAQGKQRARRIG